MRLLIAALLLLTVPGLAGAQSSRASRARAPQPPQQQQEVPALPPIGLRLPPIGLPLPAIGLPPLEAGNPAPFASPAPRRSHPGGEKRRGRPGPNVIYVVPAYGWSATPVAPAPEAPVAAPVVETPPRVAPRQPVGTLRLDLQPRVGGQVFVDGVYVGTLDEFGDELTLDAGTRQVELRQAGFETLTLPVRIDDGRALTYRGSLAAAGCPARRDDRAGTGGEDARNRAQAVLLHPGLLPRRRAATRGRAARDLRLEPRRHLPAVARAHRGRRHLCHNPFRHRCAARPVSPPEHP